MATAGGVEVGLYKFQGLDILGPNDGGGPPFADYILHRPWDGTEPRAFPEAEHRLLPQNLELSRASRLC